MSRAEGVRVTYDRTVDAAYVYLGGGQSATTVPLDELAEAEGLDALHSILLDFDADGRLIGVEVLSARKSLNQAILPDL